MKIRLQLAAALAAMLIISNTLPTCAGSADSSPETTAPSQGDTLISDASLLEDWESVTSGDHFSSSDDTPEQESSEDKTEDFDMTVPGAAPAFSAHVAYSPHGYVVKGTFTEILPGTSLIRQLYSLDGEVWQTCGTAWTPDGLNCDTLKLPTAFQNQIFLYESFEPLSDYIAGQFNRFYLKLQITLENGLTYETQAAVIDHGDPLTIPEELTPMASFTSAMRILQRRPFKLYGQYQITVSADATPEDISLLLPDTLPMEVQLFAGNNMVTKAIVDCPITWKPLSLPRLTAGESITIEDAAEKIIVPAGTLLNTPTGIFQLNEPLGIAQDDIYQNEIRVVLNVVEENADPTGVLAEYYGGLEAAFHLKPTGATAIRAYTLSEGGDEWVELPDSLLLEELNAPSSIANSAYTSVLRNTSEPYQSYLAELDAGDEPVPFLVGLRVEGGVYDGRQLILAWPNTYEPLTTLPLPSGHGGNESNAGSDNKNDSTPEGQRPGLPQDPEERPEGQEQEPDPPLNPADGQEANEQDPPLNPADGQEANEQDPPLNPKDEQDTREPDPPHNPEDGQDAKDPEPPQNLTDGQGTGMQDPPQNPKGGQETGEPELPQSPGDEQDIQGLELSQPPKYKPEVQPPASYISAARPETQSAVSQAPEDQQPELPDILEKEPKDQQTQQISITKPLPALTVGAEKPVSAPGLSAETGSPADGKNTLGTGLILYRYLLPAAAAIAMSLCIAAAAGKVLAGSMSGRISRKIMRAIYRFLHLK